MSLKFNYAAALVDKQTETYLRSLGVTKSNIHMTTFFDRQDYLKFFKPYRFTGSKEALVELVTAWPVPSGCVVVAVLDCPWSKEINKHYLAQGGTEDLPHRAHVTLAKLGKNESYADLVKHLDFELSGKVLTFDRHVHEMWRD